MRDAYPLRAGFESGDELRNESVMNDGPVVSVVIPYYKRGEIFERGLESVLRQDYLSREIIVVDDHSEDGLRERIEAHDRSVKLIELPQNAGACAARNAGILAARGTIVTVLDDDAGFCSSFEISKLVKVFEEHPDIHVVAFQICHPETGELQLRDWCHPRSWQAFSQTEFETHHFGEGASAFRRYVFHAAGLYYEPFFYGAEGHDMEIRLLDHGFRFLYTPKVRIWHAVSDLARSVDRQYYYFTRNYIWMAYKDYPFAAGVRFLAQKLAMMLYFTVRLGCYRSFWRGLRDGFGGWRHIRGHRTPASKATLRHWKALEKWRPSLLLRLARHRVRPQI